jgi:hypothetical protein
VQTDEGAGELLVLERAVAWLVLVTISDGDEGCVKVGSGVLEVRLFGGVIGGSGVCEVDDDVEIDDDVGIDGDVRINDDVGVDKELVGGTEGVGIELLDMGAVERELDIWVIVAVLLPVVGDLKVEEVDLQ